MAGVDVELAPPRVRAARPGAVRLPRRRVTSPRTSSGSCSTSLSARVLPGGSTGFFHPDRFTFGQPLLLSDLVAAAMAVPGLARVEVRRFAGLGAAAAVSRANLAAGRISAGPREVLRCDSDPNNPEAGRVDVLLGGGS